MKVVTEILQDLEILKRLLKHNANLKIRINYYITFAPFSVRVCSGSVVECLSRDQGAASLSLTGITALCP